MKKCTGYIQHTVYDLLNTHDPAGPGKPERGKGTDIRIKLERPHDHQSSSVSQPHLGLNCQLAVTLHVQATLALKCFIPSCKTEHQIGSSLEL